MKKYTNLVLILFFITIISCGYQPLLSSKDTNFYIGKLSFEGNRSVNNYISKNLKKFEKGNGSENKYDLNIITAYKKTITNKDSEGNPKSYNIEIDADIIIIYEDGNKINKKIIKNKSLSAKSKKIKEKELEKEYIQNLTRELTKDLIFFLKNQ